ncbi:MAG TPA: hypothetical protein VD866_06530 [Urbifossiella sp.]|nr:hypothetical protein [Urbifossiella sp.]
MTDRVALLRLSELTLVERSTTAAALLATGLLRHLHSAAFPPPGGEPLLLTLVPVHRVEGDPAPTYHAEYIGRTATRLLPMPATVRLRVVVVDGRPDPFRLTIPVTVWPSAAAMLTWWGLVCLGIVGIRWRDPLAHSASVWDVIPQLGADGPFLLQLILLGVVVLGILRLVGWALTFADPGRDDA